MGFLKELLLFATYFLILSTVLQSEDAFSFFEDSEYVDETDEKPSATRQLFIYFIFATLCYLTLLIVPYTNLTLRQLSFAGCCIILSKYVFELLYFTKHLMGIFELAAIVSDVIGESIFYLTSVRVIQVIG
jgi:hypothetical protein